MGRSLRIRRAVLGIALTAHLAQPLAGYAQVVADPAAARRPVVDAAANGVPLVQIVAPSGAGVSRNLYQQFNVDRRGLILNNSTGVVATQLGGYVAGNPQLGAPARIILNEVTGAAASMLSGYSEIAGSRAELVIANPNGITCAGCGFINASRSVLTTGTPVFGPLGTLDAFDVRRGMVTFEGAGLNARNVDRVDVLARAIAANAEVWANALNLVAGANRVDYASLGATRIAGEGAAPAYALDVAAIGGMYADRIRLVGTEAGLGVNMRGAMQSLAGEMTLTAEGRLVNAGRLAAAGPLSVRMATGIENGGTAYAQGSANVATGGALANSGVLAAGGDVTVSAASLASAGALAAGVTPDGSIGTSGTLDVRVDGAASVAGGQAAAGAALRIAAGSIDASAARISAGRDLALTASTGADIDVAAAGVRNVGGTIESGGALSVASRGAVDNTAGRLRAQGDATITAGGTFGNAAGLVAAGGNASLRAATVDNTSGEFAADRDLAIDAQTLAGAGRAAAGSDLTLTLGGDHTNVAGATLEAGGTLTLATPGALSNAGRIDGAIVRTRSRSLANTAAIIGGQVEARADDIANTGAAAVIGAVTDLRLRVRGTFANSDGALAYSGGDLSIAADDAGARSARVLNEGATIEAAGNVAIAAQTLENRRRDVAIVTDTIATLATPYQLRDESWSADVVNNPAYNPLILEPADRLPYERQRVVTTTITEDRVASASPPAQILAGSTLAIDAGSVINHASRIAAAGNAGVSGAVQNQGYTLSRTSKETITHQLCTDIQGAGPGHPGSCASGWLDVDTFTSTAIAIGALPATLEGAAVLAIAGPSVRNVALNASGAPASPIVTTFPPGSGPGAAGALPSTGAGAASPIVLPTSGLYTLRTDPGHPFLVETDPRFTSYGRFISSDYMLSRLALTPATTLKRLGDAFYETRLVREEIYRLTGRRFLAGYASDYDTFLALMDEGLAAERRLELAVGVALSDAQVAALTKDIVWMVEREVTTPGGAVQKVLVPVVYLARATGRDLSPDGALIAAEDVDLKSYGELFNSGTIAGGARLVAEGTDVENVGGTLASRGVTAVTTQRDLANRSGTIRGIDVRLDAGRDLVNETLTGTVASRNATQTVFGARGRMEASGALEGTAGRDVVVRGAAVRGDSVAITADRDVFVDTVAARERLGTFDGSDHVGIERERNAGSSLAADRTLALSAGRDATLIAAQVRAGGDLGVVARGNVTVAAAEDRSAFTFRGQGKGWSAQGTGDAHSVVGSSLSAGSNVVLAAGANPELPAAVVAAAAPPVQSSSDLLILGSIVRSDAGGVTLAATRDLVIGSVAQRTVSQSQESRRSGSFLSRRRTEESRTLDAAIQVGSLVSGETVTAVVDRDLAVRGSHVVSTGDLALSAGRNVEISASQSTLASSRSRSERRSGVFGSTGGGGLGFTIGTQSQSNDVLETSVTNVASVVGSSAGSVAIAAGETYRQHGSQVLAAQDITISAAEVAIEAGQDRYSRQEDSRFRRSGLSVTVFAPVITPAVLARDAVQRADDVEDARLKAVYALRATRYAVGAMREAQALADASASPQVGLKVGVGSTSSESTSRYTASAGVPASVSAGGDVDIRATGAPATGRGDLAVTGSQVSGANVTLSAARDLTLRSAVDSSTLQTENTASNFSVGVGVSVGAGGTALAGFYAQGGRERGNEDGSTLTHAETIVSARETLTLASGRDTTLSGAIASGQDVAAIVGRNLLLQSQQDLDTYRQRSTQVSAGVGFGLGAPSFGVSAARLRTDSDFASVQEQTAIRAGAGGFDIRVGEHTQLAGAVIDSTATPERNRLSTGTLGFSDIDNRAEYSSATLGLSVGGTFGRTPGAIPIVGSGGAEERQGTTLAAVAPGTIEIRNPQAQTQDLASLSRNPGGANAALERIFDKKTVAERQELATIFGQEAFLIVGDIAKAKTRPYELAQLARSQAQAYLTLKERDERDQLSAAEREQLARWEQNGAGVATARDKLARAETDLAIYQADYEAWKEGGANKVALHVLVGAVQAAFGGAPAAAGALGAGTAESVRGLTEGLSPELQQWASVVIGGAAGATAAGTAGSGALAGAQAGLTGEQFNRQLHPSEEAWLRAKAKDFATQEGISEQHAMERLTQQALRDVDLFWRSLLKDGDDGGAKDFLAQAEGTFRNDLGEQQKLFTTNGQQLLRPEMFADVADPAFYRRFAQSGIARSLNQGLLKEIRDAGIDLKDAAAQFAKTARENPGLVLNAVWDAVRDLPSSLVDSFRETGQAVGEGSAVTLDAGLTEKLNAIYGADVSTAQQTLLAVRIATSLTGAAGTAKAGARLSEATAGALGKKLDEILDEAARESLKRSGGVVDRDGQPLLDMSKLSHQQKATMGDLFGQETVRRIVPDGEKLARVPGVGEKGIDDLYKVNRPDVDYVVIEYKFVGDPKNPNRTADVGSDRLNKTKDGLQGSERWILGGTRLQRSVGLDRAIDIQNAVRTGRTETWAIAVRPDGSTVVEVLDGLGKPKDIDTSKLLRPNVDLSGVKP